MKSSLLSSVATALSLALVAVLARPAHAAGGPDYALSFDGSDDYVHVGTNFFAAGANTFTIELWVSPAATRAETAEANSGISSISGQRYAVFPDQGDAGYGAGHAGAGLSVGSNGISVFEHADNYLPSLLVYSASISGWTHVALVYVERQPQLYVNGTFVRTGLTSSKTFVHPSSNLGGSIQGPGYGNYQGQLDEVRIWGVALNQTQIQNNMNRRLSGAESGLLAYFRCDEGGGTALTDSAPAGGNSDGMLRNGTAFVLSGVVPFTPSVDTLPASSILSTTATLNGVANPRGTNTSAWFEWGETSSYGNVTPEQVLGSGSSSMNFSQVVTGLVVGVTYHFRAIASNSLGIVSGANQSFTITVFTEIDAGLQGARNGSVAWADYDNDGRLDILLTGATLGVERVSQVWRNTGSGFSNINAGLPGVASSSAAWGDYDNDGRLDILLIGSRGFSAIAQLWRNTSTGFVQVYVGLPGVYAGSVAWGDYDNDGRLDILLTGYTDPGGAISQVWRNTGSGFTNINAGLPGVASSSAAWGDYDNDGRLDILLTGYTDPGGAISQVWRNTGSGFTNINAGLPGVAGSSAAWGDYDNDGRLDILLTGTIDDPFSNDRNISQLWRNTGSGFANIGTGLPGIANSSVAWGDYDNDGRPDILLTGQTYAGEYISQVWRNTGSGFSNINAGLPGVYLGAVAWGDYDNDSRLDILLNGLLGSSTISQVWHNNSHTNSPRAPSVTSFSASISDTNAVTATRSVLLNASIIPHGLPTGAWFEFGSSTARLARILPVNLPPVYVSRNTAGQFDALSPGVTYYYRAVASNSLGVTYGLFQTLTVPPLFSAGDLNGDGIVDEAELSTVLSNYWPHSPWLYMTNVAGLGGTNISFAVTNSLAGAFSVEYTTNLMDWEFLGLARPRYDFTDTNAPAEPQRYYRLRWP